MSERALWKIILLLSTPILVLVEVQYEYFILCKEYFKSAPFRDSQDYVGHFILPPMAPTIVGTECLTRIPTEN
jgi:hypothetical protein